MKKLIGSVAVLGLTAAAYAQFPLSETEANNSPATANFVGAAFYPFGGVAIDGSLSPGDVDYFSFDLAAGDLVGVAVYDFTDAAFDNDSLLGVFGPGGVFFDSDDDDGIGFLSSYQFEVPSTGTWSFAVSGFGDNNFDGSHQEEFDYKFSFAINPIPEPASLGLLLAGAAFALRRR